MAFNPDQRPPGRHLGVNPMLTYAKYKKLLNIRKKELAGQAQESSIPSEWVADLLDMVGDMAARLEVLKIENEQLHQLFGQGGRSISG